MQVCPGEEYCQQSKERSIPLISLNEYRGNLYRVIDLFCPNERQNSAACLLCPLHKRLTNSHVLMYSQNRQESGSTGTPLLWRRSGASKAEMGKGMRATSGSIQISRSADQSCAEHVPFFVSAIIVSPIVSIVCVCVVAVVYAVSSTYFETGAQASVSLCGLSHLTSLLASLTLIGLARLIGLQSLVGLTTRLAASTA